MRLAEHDVSIFAHSEVTRRSCGARLRHQEPAIPAGLQGYGKASKQSSRADETPEDPTDSCLHSDSYILNALMSREWAVKPLVTIRLTTKMEAD